MDNELYKSSFGPNSIDDSFKSQTMPISSWGEDDTSSVPPTKPEPTPIVDKEPKKEKQEIDIELAKFKKTLGWEEPRFTKNLLKDAVLNAINRIKCLWKINQLPPDKLPQSHKGTCLWYLFAVAGVDIAAMLALLLITVSIIATISTIIIPLLATQHLAITFTIFDDVVKIFAKVLVAWGVLTVARVLGVELNKEHNEDVVKIVSGVLLAVFLLICF